MSGKAEDKGPVEQATDKAKEAAETVAENAKHIQPGVLLNTGLSCCLNGDKPPMLDAAVRHAERSSERPLLSLLGNRRLTGRQGENCIIASGIVACTQIECAYSMQPCDVI